MCAEKGVEFERKGDLHEKEQPGKPGFTNFTCLSRFAMQCTGYLYGKGKIFGFLSKTRGILSPHSPRFEFDVYEDMFIFPCYTNPFVIS